MIYVPFLKLKNNELLSLKDLDTNCKDLITPFFDIPRVRDMDEYEFIKKVDAAEKSLERHWKKNDKFYIDTFDIDQGLRPDGVCPYEYIAGKLSSYKIIPVVGLDRDDDHIEYVHRHIEQSIDKEVAIRFLVQDFEDYNLVKYDISDILSGIISVSAHIDIILDCRVITAKSVKDLVNNATLFSHKICKKIKCRRIIITGSSIPSFFSEITPTNSETLFCRYEPDIWNQFADKFTSEGVEIIFGDYGVISPEYSDVDLEPAVLATISTPKAIYTLKNNHFAVRGSRFYSHKDGHNQYYDLAQKIVEKKFYRGQEFSLGDKYIKEKSLRIPKPGSPQSWLKNTLNAHLTYIITELTS